MRRPFSCVSRDGALTTIHFAFPRAKTMTHALLSSSITSLPLLARGKVVERCHYDDKGHAMCRRGSR